MEPIPKTLKNINELYEEGYQSKRICGDCWQTNFIHVSDKKRHEITCMCGHKYELWVEGLKYDFTDEGFLWRKPKRHQGTCPMVYSQMTFCNK